MLQLDKIPLYHILIQMFVCSLEFEHFKAFNFCDGTEGK